MYFCCLTLNKPSNPIEKPRADCFFFRSQSPQKEELEELKEEEGEESNRASPLRQVREKRVE